MVMARKFRVAAVNSHKMWRMPFMEPLKKIQTRNVLTVGAIVMALAAGYAMHGLKAEQDNKQTPVTTAPVVQTPAIEEAAKMQNAFADVAKAAEPAVVTITTERKQPKPTAGQRGQDPFGGGPFDPFGGG